jgi:hypothetical protein
MMKRSRLRWTACVLAGILVSVQAAFALAACMPPASEPAQAIAQTEVPPCHEQQAQVDGLCVLHCLGDRQSLDKPSVKVPALGEAPVLVVLTPMLHAASYLRMPDAPVRVSAPPLRILFSKLLI